MNSKRSTGIVVAVMLALNIGAWVTTPFDPIFIAATAPVCVVMVAAWLWVYRRRLVPGVVVSLHDPVAMLAANRQLRRWRPWMWGPLRRLWIYELHMIEFPLVAVGTHHWKGRAEWRLEKQMDRRCCHPDQERGHEHCETKEENHEQRD